MKVRLVAQEAEVPERFVVDLLHKASQRTLNTYASIYLYDPDDKNLMYKLDVPIVWEIAESST